MRKVCVQILYTEDWLKIALYSIRAAVHYCRRHGYTWDIKCVNSPYDTFEKLKNIKDIFHTKRAEIVWSLDADAIITNPNIRVDKLLGDGDLFISKDYKGLNCGSFLVKDTEYSYDLLNWLLKQKGKEGIMCEKDALQLYMNEYPKNQISILPQSAINSYKYELYPDIPEQSEENGQWVEGKSLVLHLPGVSMNKRKEIFQSIKIHE